MVVKMWLRYCCEWEGQKGIFEMLLRVKSFVSRFVVLGLGVVTVLTVLNAGPAQAAERQPPTWHGAIPVHIGFTFQPDLTSQLKVDLRPEIRQRGLHIRDQGNRGTCTVFATTFLIEYQKAGESGQPKGLKLSEEYLNWAANEVNGPPYYDGGMFTKMIAGFETWGIASANQMRYRSAYNAIHPVQPTPAAKADARTLFPAGYTFTTLKVWDDTKGMTAGELQNVLSTLRAGTPVATGIWWLSNFSTVTVHGIPILSIYPRSANTGSNPPMFDGHTIDLVGYRESKNFPGGGYFVFRNSFGPAFGDHGYGYVSFKYIRTYANDAIAVAGVPHVRVIPITHPYQSF